MTSDLDKHLPRVCDYCGEPETTEAIGPEVGPVEPCFECNWLVHTGCMQGHEHDDHSEEGEDE